MIFEFQMSASSLRQLSILSEPACAAASPATNAAAAIPPRFQAPSILMLPSSFASFMPAFASNLSPASDHRHIPTAIFRIENRKHTTCGPLVFDYGPSVYLLSSGLR